MIHQKIKEALGDDGYINFIKHFAARRRAEKGQDGSKEYISGLEIYLEEKASKLYKLLYED